MDWVLIVLVVVSFLSMAAAVAVLASSLAANASAQRECLREFKDAALAPIALSCDARWPLPKKFTPS